MTPETTGLDLLRTAEQTLMRELAPALSGEARFTALMVASAMRMVMRELMTAEALAATQRALYQDLSPAALAHAVRVGVHDSDQALFDALFAEARSRTAMSRGPQPG